jgi:glucosyl-dolichyl phosphate glucuronosyltransferase
MLLTIIIPTRDRAHRLSALLDSLAMQEPVSFDWEVIVVDNGSNDNTQEITVDRINSYRFPIRYVREPRPGLHRGRHLGTKLALGKFVSYLDDDMVLATSWLQGVYYLTRGTSDAVVGRILPKWEGRPPGFVLNLARQPICGYYGLLDLGGDPKPISFVFGGNFFVMRNLVLNLGGFNPDGFPKEYVKYRGDGEDGFFQRFRSNGLRAWYVPEALAFHVIPAERMTMDYLYQRAFNQGISQSFSDIRAIYYLDGVPGNSMSKSRLIRFAQRLSTKLIERTLVSSIFGIVRRKLSLKRRLLEARLAQAQEDGWRWHQQAVKDDPRLLEYVLRKNYLDDKCADPPEEAEARTE